MHCTCVYLRAQDTIGMCGHEGKTNNNHTDTTPWLLVISSSLTMTMISGQDASRFESSCANKFDFSVVERPRQSSCPLCLCSITVWTAVMWM